MSEFVFDVVEIVDGKLVCTGKHTQYNLDDKQSAADWVREGIKEYPLDKKKAGLASACVYKSAVHSGSWSEKALGYLVIDGNIIERNAQHVGLFAYTFSHGQGLCVFKENFDRCISLFTARKIIKSDWITGTDPYMVPNTEHPKYEEWLNDCLIYSLFDNSSQQSSLRDLPAEDVKNIYNEFFWVDLETMKLFLKKSTARNIYNDCIKHGKPRYVAEKLKSKKLSMEALMVLDHANKLILDNDMLKLREATHQVHPEWHLLSWDAGYAQLKYMLKSYDKKHQAVTRMTELMNVLKAKLVPQVYELGFLKQSFQKFEKPVDAFENAKSK